MTSAATSVDQYMTELPDERKPAMEKLRAIILKNLPQGFEEVMNYGMLGYVVPHSIYPAGYHCNPKLPLPFMGLASQKNAISFYHMGIYANPGVMNWFTEAYARNCKSKPDMGKSCLRFKKTELIPFELIGELVSKMSVKDWIDCYEQTFRSNKSK